MLSVIRASKHFFCTKLIHMTFFCTATARHRAREIDRNLSEKIINNPISGAYATLTVEVSILALSLLL